VPGELDAEMTEATNALHGHKIAGTERCITNCVVRRHTRAKKRRRVDCIERVGKRDHRVSIGDHHFCISTIHADSGDGEILTIDRISPAAKLTVSVGTAEKADADSLSETPLRDAGANCLDTPCHFVPRNSGKTKTWKLALDR
jgi:hypothetical protein